jgi:hypothetical protein
VTPTALRPHTQARVEVAIGGACLNAAETYSAKRDQLSNGSAARLRIHVRDRVQYTQVEDFDDIGVVRNIGPFDA